MLKEIVFACMIAALMFFINCGAGLQTDTLTPSTFATFSGTSPQVDASTFAPGPGPFSTPQSVLLHSDTPGATIRFTPDGSDPFLYGTDVANDASIGVNASLTLRAYAYCPDVIDSDESMGVYSYDSSPPMVSGFSPADGSGGISLQTPIVVYFNEQMDPASITADTADTTCAGYTIQVSDDNFAACKPMQTGPAPDAGLKTFTMQPQSPGLHSIASYRLKITTAACDAAGNHLAAGYTTTGFNTEAGGMIDTGFGAGGTVTEDISSASQDYAQPVIIQSGGEILVGGFYFTGTNRNLCLMRYQIDGTCDSSFGANGKVITPLTYDQFGRAIAADRRDVYVTGYLTSPSPTDFLLTRYSLVNGAWDNAFAGVGMLGIDINSGSADAATSACIGSSGNIVMAGSSTQGVDQDFVRWQFSLMG